MSDNCDHNFGTFDDFGVKNDQKVSNNMILMSKYKGKHGGKKGQKIRAWVDPHPPIIRAMPERKRFFSIEAFPYVILFGPVFLSLHAKTILLKSTRLLIARMLCCHS